VKNVTLSVSDNTTVTVNLTQEFGPSYSGVEGGTQSQEAVKGEERETARCSLDILKKLCYVLVNE